VSHQPDLRLLAGGGELVAYFGYGSLVNRATHRTRIVHAVPARINGWRRHWRARPDMPGFPAALLTVTPEPGAVCDGLLIFDHAASLSDIDRREARYRRLEISPSSISGTVDFPAGCPVFLYRAEETLPLHPAPPRILRSYLDAVLQGFLVEHGEEGVRRFVRETAGFHFPIEEDRTSPIYPRAVRLSEAEKRFFDGLCARLA
jgi:hypothetical protein